MDRVGEVGVGEHDVGRLASELQRHTLEGVGAVLHDQLADLERTGEPDLVDLGTHDEWMPGGLAEAGDDVEHPGRQTCFLEDLRDLQSGQRRLLGRLQDRGAPRGECRSDLLDRHQHRVVPRRDHRRDPDRLLDDEAHRSRPDRWDVSVDLGRPAAVVLEHEGDLIDVVLGLGQRLARVARFHLHEPVVFPPSDLGGAHQDAGPLALRHRRPRTGIERGAGGIDRRVHIGGLGIGSGRQNLAGRRLEDVEATTVAGVDPLPVDVVLKVHRVSLATRTERPFSSVYRGGGHVRSRYICGRDRGRPPTLR